MPVNDNKSRCVRSDPLNVSKAQSSQSEYVMCSKIKAIKTPVCEIRIWKKVKIMQIPLELVTIISFFNFYLLFLHQQLKQLM